jgi:hypothetical protein
MIIVGLRDIIKIVKPYNILKKKTIWPEQNNRNVPAEIWVEFLEWAEILSEMKSVPICSSFF